MCCLGHRPRSRRFPSRILIRLHQSFRARFTERGLSPLSASPVAAGVRPRPRETGSFIVDGCLPFRFDGDTRDLVR